MDLLNQFSGVVHWLPRLTLAATFLYHGLGKFPMAEGMAQIMGWPVILVYLLALAEIGGALGRRSWTGLGDANRRTGLLHHHAGRHLSGASAAWMEQYQYGRR